jgi:6-pyruvoyltetrahydropterin/6-carboxytetrahydropterin synthase
MTIKKEYKFYAGHRNQELKEKCFRPHGHDYKLFCIFNVKRTGSISTLFNDFDSKIEPWLKENFDHRFLIDKNDPLRFAFDQHREFTGEDLGYKMLPFPTSVENVCLYLFDVITKMGFDLEMIELQETRTSTVNYTKHDYNSDKHLLQ